MYFVFRENAVLAYFILWRTFSIFICAKGCAFSTCLIFSARTLWCICVWGTGEVWTIIKYNNNASTRHCSTHRARVALAAGCYCVVTNDMRHTATEQTRQPYNHSVIVRVPCDVRPTCQLTCSLPVRPVITHTHTYLQCVRIRTRRCWLDGRMACSAANDTLDDCQVDAIMSSLEQLQPNTCCDRLTLKM